MLRKLTLGLLLGLLALPMSARAQTTEEIIPLDIPLAKIPNYRQDMRDMFHALSSYAHNRDKNFTVLIRDGFELFQKSKREFVLEELKDPVGLTLRDRMPIGEPDLVFLSAVDGVLIDGLHCGQPTMTKSVQDFARAEKKMIFSIDHCASEAKAAAAVRAAIDQQEIAHADTDATGLLDTLPRRGARPEGENPDNIFSPVVAKNMLAFLDSRRYPQRTDWVMEMMGLNYDILLVDGFHHVNESLTFQDVEALKYKLIGSTRLIFARLNLSMAQPNRYYWKSTWRLGEPSWLVSPSRETRGVYHTEFWHPDWKRIVGEYFAGLMDLGFDGIVIEGLDAYQRWETLTPLD